MRYFCSTIMVFVCVLNICLIAHDTEMALADDDTSSAYELITPADVYVEVQRVGLQVMQLGKFMGIPEPEPLGINLSMATPHDVYFQAQALATKANRLSFEILRKTVGLQPFPGGVIKPDDVKHTIITALVTIIDVNKALGVQGNGRKIIFERDISPSDVFEKIMAINRHLSLLLERRFTPSDVYEVINFAIGYSVNLLTLYPETDRLPQKEKHQKNKQPVDVYNRLRKCLVIIERIYNEEDLGILDIDFSNLNENHISPSDVYDMAMLIVAQLNFLHKHYRIRRGLRDPFYPGRRFPSDVYQQVSVLEQQLVTLHSRTVRAIQEQDTTRK